MFRSAPFLTLLAAALVARHADPRVHRPQPCAFSSPNVRAPWVPHTGPPHPAIRNSTPSFASRPRTAPSCCLPCHPGWELQCLRLALSRSLSLSPALPSRAGTHISPHYPAGFSLSRRAVLHRAAEALMHSCIVTRRWGTVVGGNPSPLPATAPARRPSIGRDQSFFLALSLISSSCCVESRRHDCSSGAASRPTGQRRMWVKPSRAIIHSPSHPPASGHLHGQKETPIRYSMVTW